MNTTATTTKNRKTNSSNGRRRGWHKRPTVTPIVPIPRRRVLRDRERFNLAREATLAYQQAPTVRGFIAFVHDHHHALGEAILNHGTPNPKLLRRALYLMWLYELEVARLAMLNCPAVSDGIHHIEGHEHLLTTLSKPVVFDVPPSPHRDDDPPATAALLKAMRTVNDHANLLRDLYANAKQGE